MKDFTTKELVEELKTRTGVTEHWVTPEQSYILNIGNVEEDTTDLEVSDSGPAIILIIVD